jgi:hypothetical protein
MVAMNNHSDDYIVRDYVEEEVEESPPWFVQCVILMTIVFGFLAIMFEHDFI